MSIKTKAAFLLLCRIYLGLPSLVVSAVLDFIHGCRIDKRQAKYDAIFIMACPILCCPLATIVGLQILEIAYFYAIQNINNPVDPRL
jgi:hypothetical protein